MSLKYKIRACLLKETRVFLILHKKYKNRACLLKEISFFMRLQNLHILRYEILKLGFVNSNQEIKYQIFTNFLQVGDEYHIYSFYLHVFLIF